MYRRRRSLLVLAVGVIILLVFAVVSGPGGDVAEARKRRPKRTTTTTATTSTSSSTTTSSTTTTSTTTTSTTTTTTTTTTTRGEPTSFTVPDGIVSDCSVDVTPQLRAWIDSVPDNSVLEFAPGACYEIENTLFVAGRHFLTFEGNGATFMAKTDGSTQTPTDGNARTWPRRRAHWWFKDSSGITIQHLTVIGANPYSGRSDAQYNPAYEVQSGVVVTSSNDVTIDGLSISKVWGDFVTIEGDSSHVTVSNSTMKTCGRQGVAITSGSHIVLQGNSFDDVRWGVFDLEPNSATKAIDDVKILDNTSGHSRWFWLASVGASPLISNIDVEHNKILVHSPSIVYVSNQTPSAGLRGPWTIAHNDFYIYWTSYAAFELAGAKDVSIFDNVVHPVPLVNLVIVRASNSNRIQIHDNDFTGAGTIFLPGNTPTWCEANNLPADRSLNVPC